MWIHGFYAMQCFAHVYCGLWNIYKAFADLWERFMYNCIVNPSLLKNCLEKWWLWIPFRGRMPKAAMLQNKAWGYFLDTWYDLVRQTILIFNNFCTYFHIKSMRASLDKWEYILTEIIRTYLDSCLIGWLRTFVAITKLYVLPPFTFDSYISKIQMFKNDWRTNKKVYVAFIRLISTLGALGHCAIWKCINQNWMEGVYFKGAYLARLCLIHMHLFFLQYMRRRP